MNKKSTAITILLLLFAAPLLAQDRDVRVTVFASQIDIDSDDLGDGFETDFDSGSGFGLGASLFVNRFLAADVAVFTVRSEAGLLFEGEAPFDLGRLNLVPVMIGAQGHFALWRLDIYGGAGGAYVMANDLSSEELDLVGLGRIEVDNELTYYLNAGVALEITKGLGIVLDGRHIPYKPSTRSTVTGNEEELDLSHNIVSLGLRFRF